MERGSGVVVLEPPLMEVSINVVDAFGIGSAAADVWMTDFLRAVMGGELPGAQW